MDSAAVNRFLCDVIPPVPCNGCNDCCNGKAAGSVKCPHLVGGKCSVYDHRPLECRLYGAIAGKPCYKGVIAIRPLSEQQVEMIRRSHSEMTGGKSRYELI